MVRKVFVYGTLRTHQENYFIIKHLVKNALAATHPGILYDLGDYPVLISGEGTVSGEVLEFHDEAAAELAFNLMDQLEEFIEAGSPLNEYERVLTTAFLEDGTETACEVYIYPEFKRDRLMQTAALIPSGDWTRRKGSSSLT